MKTRFSLSEVAAQINRSTKELRAMVACGRFPAPSKRTRTSETWSQDDINRWSDQEIANMKYCDRMRRKFENAPALRTKELESERYALTRLGLSEQAGRLAPDGLLEAKALHLKIKRLIKEQTK